MSGAKFAARSSPILTVPKGLCHAARHADVRVLRVSCTTPTCWDKSRAADSDWATVKGRGYAVVETSTASFQIGSRTRAHLL